MRKENPPSRPHLPIKKYFVCFSERKKNREKRKEKQLLVLFPFYVLLNIVSHIKTKREAPCPVRDNLGESSKREKKKSTRVFFFKAAWVVLRPVFFIMEAFLGG